MCSSKTVEFETSTSRSEEVFVTYAEQQQSVEVFVSKLESEIEHINQDLKELESSLLNTVNKIQKHEEALNSINKQVRDKVSKCRSLQEQRTLLQNQISQKNQSTAAASYSDDTYFSDMPSEILHTELTGSKFPPSSSSSSSSTRMLREQITSTAGEEIESPASSPPLKNEYLR